MNKIVSIKGLMNSTIVPKYRFPIDWKYILNNMNITGGMIPERNCQDCYFFDIQTEKCKMFIKHENGTFMKAIDARKSEKYCGISGKHFLSNE